MFKSSGIMSSSKLVGLGCLLLLLGVFTAVHAIDHGTGEFVATHEWQEVPEGVAVPPGLHIQMDFQTGKKIAKLMDNRKTDNRDLQDTSLVVVEQEDGEEELKSTAPKLTAKEWSEVLQALGMKAEDPSVIFNQMFNKLVLQEYQDEDELVLLLEELDEAIHDIDLAKGFVDMGGIPHFESLLLKFEAEKNYRVLSALLTLVRSASQNNAYVAGALARSNILHQCVLILESSMIQETQLDTNTTKESEVLNLVIYKAISAVSSIARASSEGLRQILINPKSVELLNEVISRPEDMTFIRSQRSAVGFIRDVVENRLVNEMAAAPSLADIESVLMTEDWCLKLLSLASGTHDLDVIDNVGSLLTNMRRYGFCSSVAQGQVDALLSEVELADGW